MKQFLLLLSITGLFLNSFGQTATITAGLQQQLNSGQPTDFVKVNVVFVDQVHHGVLNAKFKAQNTPLAERAKTVIRLSTQLAESSQQPIIKLLNDNSSKVKDYKGLWIINMMTIEASKDFLVQLSQHPSIDYMEEYDHFTGKPIEIRKGKASAEKSIGGIEPGLAAINAPALWAMGYTGKARKYYSIDTGVWPQHPAITDNWLGNYQPISQAWYGIDSPTPVDKVGTHGTHTTGTVLGLEPATNDTIGVAFNAYFMVSDPIVVNISEIKPLPEYIDVFQFALNPDGDTATTDDIPDAINNSWGIDEHHDTSICAGYVTQMFDAIEAAGIANVFSAGNEGPADTTIGKPQYVTTGLVNTFTVGAVNGALGTFPITSFSSHGPTACPSTGSLRIKPEVVAPGLNVRSSVDLNNYANYNGTSMAGPHATGAVLLLKEAFPNVSGEDILLALYNSAIDLGVAGEDNTYGKGMIDVLAAYNELALTYTPTPPNQYSYDLKVDKIINPSIDYRCDQSIAPTVVLKNSGDSTITAATIIYQLNSEGINTFNWNGTLIAGDTTSVNLPTITALGYGDYELFVKATIDTLNIECDYINNQRVQRFNIRTVISNLPYHEHFENMRLDSSDWLVNNPDLSITWDTSATAGLPTGTHSAKMNFFDYNGSTQEDDLISQQIALPLEDSLFLRFDLAYNLFIPSLTDSLRIMISNDCGNTFSQLYSKGGTNLQTHDTMTVRFVPIYPHHWRTEYVDITAYAGDNVLIQFQTYNMSGNNLYVDNIWVYEGAEPIGIEENMVSNISIYPNPTEHTVTVDIDNNNIQNARIEVLDLVGKSLYQQSVNQKINKINMANYSTGVYLIKFSNSEGSVINKIIKR